MMLASSDPAAAAIGDGATVGNDLKAAPPKPGRSATKAEALSLRLLGGFHSGATRSLRKRDVLMVGHAADCDVILADPGVGRHHCLIARDGARLTVRAVDSPLTVNGQAVPPGEPIAIEAGARIAVGDALLTVARTEAGAPEQPWAAPAAAGAAAIRRWRGLPWWSAGLGTALVCGAIALVASHYWRGAAVRPAAPVEQVDRVVRSMGLHEVAVTEKADGKMLVQGVVPDAKAASTLRTAVRAEAPQALVNLRPGDDVAEDVAEILRLKGIDAAAVYEGEGRVRVEGHLGDEKALTTVIQSRAMHDIQGLKKVVAVNLDSGKPKAAAAPKRVVSINNGSDPYVVTADGSRYFVGARLPNGLQLTGIEGSDILLDDGRGPRRRNALGTSLATP